MKYQLNVIEELEAQSYHRLSSDCGATVNREMELVKGAGSRGIVKEICTRKHLPVNTSHVAFWRTSHPAVEAVHVNLVVACFTAPFVPPATAQP